MTWHTSTVDGDIVIRDTIFEKADAAMRFCFGLGDDTDAGQTAAGPLFKQDGDFFMFEAEIVDVERAGPSRSSPFRCFGTLGFSLMTKNSSRELHHRKLLEQTARWFADKTIRGIRFRSFLPVSTTQLIGFTSYSGVINFDFEMTQEQ